jgi:RNA polymerase sigma factor (sigma-70 family)
MRSSTKSSVTSMSRAAVEFERLLEPLIPVLFRHAYRWTAARDQAEDLVQELLLRLYPRLDELADLDRVQPWVLRVMYRIFVDQYRRESRSPVRPGHELPTGADGESTEPGERFADEGPSTLEQVEAEFTQESLLAAWNRLGEDHRVVLAMHDIEGYPLEEVSEMLEVPVGTLKSRLHRARARMRDLLSKEPFVDAIRDQQYGN